MKEIYILNKGDNIDKVRYEYKNISNCQVLENNELNVKYVDLTKGSDEVQIVRNYLPIYEYVINPNDTIIELLSKGYKIDHCRDIEVGDTVILSKPRSIRYVVKPLETISDIAEKFGVKVQYILDTNQLSTEKLFIGQILWI